MFTTGDIVITRKNNKELMFIVLFNLWHNEKECVCVCPVTNTTRPKTNAKYFLRDYVYIPFEILDDKRKCSIKISDASMYQTSELYPTGLKLKPEIMLRTFNTIMELNLERPSLNKEHYEYIKNIISILSEELENYEAKRKKEEKKLRKARRKELKRNYKSNKQ